MEKQMKGSQLDDTRLDDNIKKILGGAFPLPKKVEDAQNEAFAKIRAMAEERAKTEKENPADALEENTKSQKSHKKIGRAFFRVFAGVAAAAVFGVYIVSMTVTAEVPIVGHVFEKMGGTLEFGGDYTHLAEQVKKTGEGIGSMAVDGTEITLSEVYCNGSALYVGLVIHSQERLPETGYDQNGKPIISMKSLVDFDFDEEEEIDWAVGGDSSIDGEMVDANTCAGVIRFDMVRYFAGTGLEAPENFRVKLSISQIVGAKLEDTSPEMPQELIEQYEAAMEENGLGLTDEDYEQFTEAQKEIEHQLFADMWNAYYEMYPEELQSPNKYRDWWMDGPWDFEIDVTRNNENVIRKDINDLDENGLGLAAVTKTPIEITVETGPNADYFAAVLDADGNLMPESDIGGSTYTVPVSGHDTSKIDIYICDYIEYMDELKVYWWSDNYEERAKEKTIKQLLDERSLYHKEITFGE